MMENINTYGELLAEIERVKASIQRVKEGPYYEQGDEMDLELYLISLKKVKKKNEERFRLLQKFGLYECDECGSIHLNLEPRRDIVKRGIEVLVTCNDCGYSTYKFVGDNDLKDNICTEKTLW